MDPPRDTGCQSSGEWVWPQTGLGSMAISGNFETGSLETTCVSQNPSNQEETLPMDLASARCAVGSHGMLHARLHGRLAAGLARNHSLRYLEPLALGRGVAGPAIPHAAPSGGAGAASGKVQWSGQGDRPQRQRGSVLRLRAEEHYCVQYGWDFQPNPSQKAKVQKYRNPTQGGA